MKKRRRKRTRTIEWNRVGKHGRSEPAGGSGTLGDALASEATAQLGKLKRRLTQGAKPTTPTRRAPPRPRRRSIFEELMSVDPTAQARLPLPVPPDEPEAPVPPDNAGVVREPPPDTVHPVSRTANKTHLDRTGGVVPGDNEG